MKNQRNHHAACSGNLSRLALAIAGSLSLANLQAQVEILPIPDVLGIDQQVLSKPAVVISGTGQTGNMRDTSVIIPLSETFILPMDVLLQPTGNLVGHLPPLPQTAPAQVQPILVPGRGRTAGWIPGVEGVGAMFPATATRGRAAEPLPPMQLPQQDPIYCVQHHFGQMEQGVLRLQLPEAWNGAASVNAHAAIAVLLPQPDGEPIEQILTLTALDNHVICGGTPEACLQRIGDIVNCALNQIILPQGFKLSSSVNGTTLDIELLDNEDQRVEMNRAGLALEVDLPRPDLKDLRVNFAGDTLADGSLLDVQFDGISDQPASDFIVEVLTDAGPAIARPLFVKEVDASSPKLYLACKMGTIPPGATRALKVIVRPADECLNFWAPAFDDLNVRQPVSIRRAKGDKSKWLETQLETSPNVIPTPPENNLSMELIDGSMVFRIDKMPEGDSLLSSDLVFALVGPQCPDPLIPDCVYDPPMSMVQFGDIDISGAESLQDLALRIGDIYMCGLGDVLDIKVNTEGDIPAVILTPLEGFALLNPCEEGNITFKGKYLDKATPLLAKAVGPGATSTGDLIEIKLEGPIPDSPDDLCIMMGQAMVHPVAIMGDTVIGRVGSLPPGGEFGRISLMHGTGKKARFTSMFNGISLPNPTWVWTGETNRENQPADPIEPPVNEPTPPEPNVDCFTTQFPGSYGPPREELCVVFEGDWCPDGTLFMEGHIRKDFGDGQIKNYDFYVNGAQLRAGGNVFDCVRSMTDLPECAFVQNLDLRHELQWCVTDLGDTDGNGENEAKLTVKCEQGGLIQGQLLIKYLCPPEDPVIKSIVTADGQAPDCVRECDILCIEICNFGTTDPNDLCAMIGDDPTTAIPLDIIEIIPGPDGSAKIIAKVAGAPDGLFSGPINISIGEGNEEFWVSNIPGLFNGRPGWTWSGQVSNSVTSIDKIVVKPNDDPDPDPDPEPCFMGVSNEEGNICIPITGTFPENSILKVKGHFRVKAPDGSVYGVDLSSPVIRPDTGGTAQDIAAIMKDVIRCQLNSAGIEPFIEPKCPDDGDNDPNTAIFKLCGTQGAKVCGKLQIKICVPPQKEIQITGIELQNDGPLKAGSLFKINGCGFCNNPDDICLMAVNAAGQSVALEVLEANGDCLWVKVGPVPAELVGQDLQLKLTKAHGLTEPINIGVAGGQSEWNAWAWSNPGQFPSVCSDVTIRLNECPPPPNEYWEFSEFNPETGKLCLTFDQDWKQGTTIAVGGHLRLPAPYGGLDLRVPRTRIVEEGNLLDCAHVIADTFRCAFAQLDGFTLIQIDVFETANGEVKIQFCWPEQGVPLQGQLSVCVTCPPGPPVIDEVPEKIETGKPVCITGTGFGDDPDNICAVVRFPNGVVVPLRVIEAEDGKLTVVPGFIPEGLQGPGCVEVMLGRGNQRNFIPMVDGLRFEENIWAWDGNNPDGGARGEKKVLEVCPTPQNNEVDYFRGVLRDGKLCLELCGDWKPDTTISLTVRAHNECQRLDLDGPAIQFFGEGTLEECVNKLKDIIICAFLQQTGAQVVVDCQRIPGTNTVKLTVALENGKPIEWGLINLCVMPGVDKGDDPDGDGLTNEEERQLGTNPNLADTDGDGLLDGEEKALGLCPIDNDCDDDGTLDGAEVLAGFDPNDANSRFVLLPSSTQTEEGRMLTVMLPNTNPDRVYQLFALGRDMQTPVPMRGMKTVGNGGDVFFDIILEANTPAEFYSIGAKK